MFKETSKHIRTLADRVSSLATFEFKDLAAGGPRSYACYASQGSGSGSEYRVGFDARTGTLWTFDSTSNDLVSPNVQGYLENVGTRSKRKREDEVGDQTREQASYSPAILPLTTPQGLGTSKASKRKRGNQSENQLGEQAPHAPGILLSTTPQGLGPRRSSRLAHDKISMPPRPLLVGVQVEAAVPKKSGTWKGKGKGKEKENAQGGDDNDDENDPSYRDNHDLSALYIIQRAWARATQVDCSIIVLQSGNHEFIGIRHRGTQILYISDLIEPHACKEPAYGKLHVGIYMAAVQDAIDRESQRAADTGDGPDGGDPSSGPSDGDNKMPKEGGSTGSGGSMMAVAAHEMAAKETWEVARGRNVILVYLHYGIYDSPAPSTFVRSGPTGRAHLPRPSREIVRNYKLEECLTIVLKSEIGHGATGEVLRGTLEVEASACVQLDVAVKLVLASEQRGAIGNEYTFAENSGVTTGITTPLGLFDDVEDEACALVMPYVGIPLSEMPEFFLPISFREAVLATLKEIHQADILHGDLRLDNILVADLGLIIIDFARSRVCYDQDAKNREYSQLQSLLTRRAKQNGHHRN